MNTLSHIIGASARFNLLRALHYLEQPVGLRQLARLAGVHPHSAERMLKDLVEEGVITRKKRQSRVMFRRCADHSDWRVLEALFLAVDKAVLDSNRARLNERARTILPFIEEADSMFRCARRTAGVA